MTRLAASRTLPITLGIFLLCNSIGDVTAGRRSPRDRPRLVLHSTDGSERMVEVEDLAFAYFHRTVYTRSAPRSKSPSRQRTEVLDRREECACLRLSDWSKVKFKKLRQIEIIYPQASRVARLRLTHRDGHVSEISAGTLYGGGDPFPPRFGATVDGLYREFPLVLEDSVTRGWPRERVSRIILVTSPPRRHARSEQR